MDIIIFHEFLVNSSDYQIDFVWIMPLTFFVSKIAIKANDKDNFKLAPYIFDFYGSKTMLKFNRMYTQIASKT